MTREASSCDLKELVGKFIPESIGAITDAVACRRSVCLVFPPLTCVQPQRVPKGGPAGLVVLHPGHWHASVARLLDLSGLPALLCARATGVERSRVRAQARTSRRLARASTRCRTPTSGRSRFCAAPKFDVNKVSPSSMLACLCQRHRPRCSMHKRPGCKNGLWSLKLTCRADELTALWCS